MADPNTTNYVSVPSQSAPEPREWKKESPDVTPTPLPPNPPPPPPSQLEIEVEQLRLENAHLKRELAAAQAREGALQHNLARYRDANGQFHHAEAAMMQEREKVAADRQELMAVFAKYKENDGRLTALNEELTHQHTDLTQRHAKLNSDYKTQRTHAENLFNESRMLQGVIEGLKHDMQRMKAHYESGAHLPAAQDANAIQRQHESQPQPQLSPQSQLRPQTLSPQHSHPHTHLHSQIHSPPSSYPPVPFPPQPQTYRTAPAPIQTTPNSLSGYNTLPQMTSASAPPTPSGQTNGTIPLGGWRPPPPPGHSNSTGRIVSPGQTQYRSPPQPPMAQVPSNGTPYSPPAASTSDGPSRRDSMVVDSPMPPFVNTPPPSSPTALMTGIELTPEIQERVNEFCQKVFQNIQDTNQYYCGLCKIRAEKDNSGAPSVLLPPDGTVFIQHCLTFHRKVYQQTCYGT